MTLNLDFWRAVITGLFIFALIGTTVLRTLRQGSASPLTWAYVLVMGLGVLTIGLHAAKQWKSMTAEAMEAEK